MKIPLIFLWFCHRNQQQRFQITSINMVLFEFFPRPALAEFIQVYRLVDISFKGVSNIPYKPYPPKAEHCLTFFPRDTESTEFAKNGKKISNLRTTLYGQLTELTNRNIGSDFLLFQVVFRPGALFRITGIPSYELTNYYIDAETVFSKDIKEINEKLNYSIDYKGMVDVVETFLLNQISKQVKEYHRLDFVSNSILTINGNFKIEDLAKESCLSIRQYERKFKERMGVSPKFFTKIVRFGNAFRMKNKYPHLDWLTIAIHCGYFDYQHLAKDYQEFTFQSPTDFHILDLSAPEREFGDKDLF